MYIQSLLGISETICWLCVAALLSIMELLVTNVSLWISRLLMSDILVQLCLFLYQLPCISDIHGCPINFTWILELFVWQLQPLIDCFILILCPTLVVECRFLRVIHHFEESLVRIFIIHLEKLSHYSRETPSRTLLATETYVDRLMSWQLAHASGWKYTYVGHMRIRNCCAHDVSWSISKR